MDYQLPVSVTTIITANIKESSFDLVVTDEFLTVLKNPYKPLIIEKWKKILKPYGTLVTTAMIGEATTPELRACSRYLKYVIIKKTIKKNHEKEKLK